MARFSNKYDVRDIDSIPIDEIVFADPDVELTSDEIVFADPDESWTIATYLTRHYDCLSICEGGEGDFVLIQTVEHVKNLIKALEKAIELGWVK